MVQLSLITPTLNSETSLDHCLTSVQQQTLKVEHIIIDGGSTDETQCILNQHKSSLARIVSEPDMGIYDAMNKGIVLASGEVIGILNSDDFYPSAKVLQRVATIFEDITVQACYGDLLYVDPHNTQKTVRHWKAGPLNSTRQFYWGWMPPHPTFFVRKSVYELYGKFCLEFGSAADYELMLRFLVKHEITTKYIPHVLVHMRTGGISNAGILHRIKANSMDRKAWIVNDLHPCWWTLWLKPLRKINQWFLKT